jgi:hypothetical protein
VRGIISQPLFSEDARWNAERQAVEFGVEIGEDRGVVGVPRGACSSGPLPERPTPRAMCRGVLSPANAVREHR